MKTHTERTYSFPPRRSAGVLGKLTIGQMGLMVAALGLLWLGVRAGSLTVFAAVAVAAAGLVAVAFARVGGRQLTAWTRPLWGALWSRMRGTRAYRGAVFAPDSLARAMDLPGDLAGVRMVSAAHPDGQSRIGLVLDERAGVVTAVLATHGTPFVLEETTEQTSRLADWEAVMESTCDTDAAIARWQLLFRSMPDSTNSAQRYYIDGVSDPDTVGAAALRELVAHAAPSAQRHEVLLAVAFELRRLAVDVRAVGGGDEGVAVVVVERLAELARQVTEARIPVRGWLSPGALAAVIRSAYDPDSQPLLEQEMSTGGVDARVAGPAATERRWSMLVHDSAVSTTLWVHELPRRPVPADWLAPVLQLADVRCSVSLVAEPLSPERAARSIANQRLSAAGSIYVRERHGLIVDSRTKNELAAAEALDDDVADGGGFFRYHMLVCVTAADIDALRRATLSVRRRLTRARCSSMVLYGEQDQAFAAAALPLARGLAPMRGVSGT
jgi:hypothetical protein